MLTYKNQIKECVKSIYPNAFIEVSGNQNDGYNALVVDEFQEEPEKRLEKIYHSFEGLDFDIKRRIGYVDTLTRNQYASENIVEKKDELQIPNDEIRWLELPQIIGMIACGVYNNPLLKKCYSSFVLKSKDKLSGERYSYGENFIYEGSAYDFIIRNGDDIEKYALEHVYNLAPSFFIAPYMDLYMKNGGLNNVNPYAFAFKELPFSFAEPQDISVLDGDDLRNLVEQVSVESIKRKIQSKFPVKNNII